MIHKSGAPGAQRRRRTACEKAGLDGKFPHDFRRSAVRRLERAAVARSAATQLVGHRTDLMYARYAITNESDLRKGLAEVAADVAGTKPISTIARA